MDSSYHGFLSSGVRRSSAPAGPAIAIPTAERKTRIGLNLRGQCDFVLFMEPLVFSPIDAGAAAVTSRCGSLRPRCGAAPGALCHVEDHDDRHIPHGRIRCRRPHLRRLSPARLGAEVVDVALWFVDRRPSGSRFVCPCPFSRREHGKIVVCFFLAGAE